jgi:putative ABC transport system permease protein
VNLGEALGTAIRSLGDHKLRSLLTMLGMIFGVGAVIAMLSIGAGAEREALRMIESLGLRNILVRAKELRPEEQEEIRKKSVGVADRDARAIEQAVPGVVAAAPRLEIRPWGVLSAAGKADPSVFGVSHRQDELASLELAEGRFLDARDEQFHAQVAVLGDGVRRELFGFEPAVGGHVKVNDVWFEVVGVLASAGSSSQSFEGVQLGSVDREVYLPVTTAQRKFDRSPLESPLSEIIVQLDRDASPRASAVAVRSLLERLHAGADDYELVVPEALLEQSRKTQRLFSLVMGCIAGISLLVGGIGIMNIMLATVLERTREIGLRRAVGARGRDIRFQFVTESFAISLLGGLAGIAMGIAIARVVAAWAGWPTVVTLSSILVSTGVAMTVGLVSGIYPALRAAALDPIEALRYE